MILLDIFSGYGGFSLGLEQAGLPITKTYFSEKDKHAIANYRYNFPEAEYLGTVEHVPSSGIKADIITFGSPCQDFSLAGKRAGLEGSNSSLIEHAIESVRRIRPSVFIWENVKGAFSSAGGADFWAIIQAFTNLGGYSLQWGLVNTLQWLPQNRERIFLVGLAADRCACEIFPLGESDENADEARQQQGDGLFVNGLDSNYHKGADGKRTMIKYGTSQDQKLSPLDGASQTLNSGHFNVPKIVVPEPTKQGYAIAEEGDSINFSVPNSKTRRGRVGKSVAQTLDTACNQAVVLQTNKSGQTFTKEEAGTLRSGASANYQCVAHYGHKDKEARVSENVPTLKAQSHGHEPMVQMTHANTVTPDAYLATGKRNRDENGKAVLTSMCDRRIRRLTPIECERLQGLPDNFLKYGIETITTDKTESCKKYAQQKDVSNLLKADKLDYATNIITDFLKKEMSLYQDNLLINLKSVKLKTVKESSKQTSVSVFCTINDGDDTELQNFQKKYSNETASVSFVMQRWERQEFSECATSTIKCGDFTETLSIQMAKDFLQESKDTIETRMVLSFIEKLLNKKSEGNSSKESKQYTILTLINLIITQAIWKSSLSQNMRLSINSLINLQDNLLELKLSSIEMDNIVLISDSMRYKMCGNGVSIPPVKAIGERIKQILT